MIGLLKYWRLAAVLISILAAFAAGWTAQGWRRDSAELDVREDDRERYRLEAQQSQRRGRKLEEKRDAIRTEYIYLMDEFGGGNSAPVACLDDERVRIVNRALRGDGAGPGERPGPVPGGDAPRERE